MDLFKEDFEKNIDKAAKMARDLSEDGALERYQSIGKHGTVIFQEDTGLGITAQDLFKQHPETFAKWKNMQSVLKELEEKAFGDIN